MSSEADEQGLGPRPVSGVRRTISPRLLVVVLTGVLAGYSASVLGADAVAVPVVGSVPGVALGTVGLLVAVVTYRRVGCCGSCGRTTFGPGSDCGCDGDCGDSCSYDA